MAVRAREPEIPMALMLTLDEVAQLARCSRRTVEREIKAERLKAKKIRGLTRVPLHEADRWLYGREQERRHRELEEQTRAVHAQARLQIDRAARMLDRQ